MSSRMPIASLLLSRKNSGSRRAKSYENSFISALVGASPEELGLEASPECQTSPQNLGVQRASLPPRESHAEALQVLPSGGGGTPRTLEGS